MASITLTSPNPVREILLGSAILSIAALGFTLGLDWSPSPAGAGAAAVADGDHTGFVTVDSDGVVRFDAAELLSGPEAVEAARADGELPAGDDHLPNDVYLRNPDHDIFRLPLAGDARVFVFDCAQGCHLGAVPTADFVAGDARAFGGANALFDVKVDDGRVVRLVEVYLP